MVARDRIKVKNKTPKSRVRRIKQCDIANLAGVSQATVSMVIQNDPRISAKTRRRVAELLRKLDYHPNVIAKGLVTQRTHNIGVAVRSIEYLEELYFALALGGIAYQVGLHDYNIHFTVTDDVPDSPSSNLLFSRKVKQGCLDGLIIIDQSMADEDIIWLEQWGLPFVLVDRMVEGHDLYTVTVDNYYGLFTATEYLLSLGHRRIGFVPESLRYSKIKEMIRGYCDALRKHDVIVDEQLYGKVDLGGKQEEAERAVRHLFGLAESPTALICSSDLLAVHVLDELKKCGVLVPQDVSLIGYNDDSRFARVEPALTTVRIPLRELGTESAALLFRILQREKIDARHVLLTPKLVIRDSCKLSGKRRKS